MIFLSINSHRACEKVVSLLGRKLEWFWTFEKGGRFITITPTEYAKIKKAKIKSVTKPRAQSQDDYYMCWR